ncbi:MAG: hypothetical protein M1565_06010 [Actinobacteria bacterium]|nr:hypothetical protein [Actinomycetota bacterium]
MVAVFDEFVGYFRTEPGFCRLWYNPAYFVSIKTREREADLIVLRLLGRKLTKLGLLDTFDVEVEFDMIVLFSQLEALLGLAFRVDPHGDPKTLDKTREIIRMQTALMVTAAGHRKPRVASRAVAVAG